MTDSILQVLLSTDDPVQRATIVAEAIIDTLPEEIASIARQCVIFHWFDQSTIEALLQDVSISQSRLQDIYEHITSLPFIETLTWGVTYQDLTREGLLKRYAVTHKELLIKAARVAASSYKARQEYGPIVAEAFFCYTVAGDVQAARELLEQLFKEAVDRQEWQYINGLLRLRDEAEQLPFVLPLPLTGEQWILRGLLHRLQDELEEAASDFSKAISINPQNILAYLIRGTIYSEQNRYEDALVEYDHAHELDPANIDVYINRGTIYFRQHRYEEAMKNFYSALQFDPNNAEALAYSQQILELESPDAAASLTNLARYYAQESAYIVAESLYQRALAIQERMLGPDHPDVAATLNNLAMLYQDQGKYSQAEPLYQRALAISERALESEHPLRIAILKNYTAMVQRMKQGIERNENIKPLLDRLRDLSGTQVRRIISTLLPPQPRFAYQREVASTWPRRYSAEDFHISIQLDRGASRRDSLQLIGFVTRKGSSPESLQGIPVVLSSQTNVMYKRNIDELGNFVFSSVSPATYTLELQLPDSTIVIEQLPVALQD